MIPPQANVYSGGKTVFGGEILVTFVEACKVLGASDSEMGTPGSSKPARTSQLFKDDQEPPAVWSERAAAFVEESEASLWSDAGAGARAYLMGKRRNLNEDTLRAWRVGFQPRERRFERASAWGLDGQDVWLPRGIVLPWIIGDKVTRR